MSFPAPACAAEGLERLDCDDASCDQQRDEEETERRREPFADDGRAVRCSVQAVPPSNDLPAAKRRDLDAPAREQPHNRTPCRMSQNFKNPEQALERDLNMIRQRLNAVRHDTTPPDRRLADNMLDYNPAATESMVQLMWGALLPGREGGLLNARLRYFDPDRKRAGVPEDVAALVSELSDTRAAVTLINLNVSQPRTVVVQGGGYGEHQLVSVTGGDG